MKGVIVCTALIFGSLYLMDKAGADSQKSYCESAALWEADSHLPHHERRGFPNHYNLPCERLNLGDENES